MKKMGLCLILISIFLSSCAKDQSFSFASTPKLETTTAAFPTRIFTDTPKVSESTSTPFPTITPTISTRTSTPTLTPSLTVTPTRTLNVPYSVKQGVYWAIVEPDRASFWFRIDPEITEWHWNLAPANRIEYEWGVEFPISQETYSAETILIIWDRKNLEPQKGTIEDLLKACDTNIWWVDSRGGISGTNKFPNAVTARYLDGGVLIELTDPTLVSSLYENRPKSFLFKTHSYFGVLRDWVIDVSVIYQ